MVTSSRRVELRLVLYHCVREFQCMYVCVCVCVCRSVQRLKSVQDVQVCEWVLVFVYGCVCVRVCVCVCLCVHVRAVCASCARWSWVRSGVSVCV